MLDWISKLFKGNTLDDKKEDERIKWKGYEFFSSGREYFINCKREEALLEFDNAFELGFVKSFPEYAAKFYDLRGGCLEELKFCYDAISDYDKSISLNPNDCNKYFARSNVKYAILDYEGAVEDLEKAIELSEVDTHLNREYNDVAQKQGYIDTSQLLRVRLMFIQTCLEFDIERRDKSRVAPRPELQEGINYINLMKRG